MNRIIMPMTIKPFNVIDGTELPEVTVDRVPVNGDPLKLFTNSDTHQPALIPDQKLAIDKR